MAGRTDGLIKNFTAPAAIAARTIVKFGAADNAVATAAAAADLLIGVTGEVPAAAGERCDVHLGGIVEVRYGGNVARGNLLTSDATGRAIAAAPAAGTTARTIGVALSSGVADDIGVALFVPGLVTTPAA